MGGRRGGESDRSPPEANGSKSEKAPAAVLHAAEVATCDLCSKSVDNAVDELFEVQCARRASNQCPPEAALYHHECIKHFISKVLSGAKNANLHKGDPCPRGWASHSKWAHAPCTGKCVATELLRIRPESKPAKKAAAKPKPPPLAQGGGRITIAPRPTPPPPQPPPVSEGPRPPPVGAEFISDAAKRNAAKREKARGEREKAKAAAAAEAARAAARAAATAEYEQSRRGSEDEPARWGGSHGDESPTLVDGSDVGETGDAGDAGDGGYGVVDWGHAGDGAELGAPDAPPVPRWVTPPTAPSASYPPAAAVGSPPPRGALLHGSPPGRRARGFQGAIPLPLPKPLPLPLPLPAPVPAPLRESQPMHLPIPLHIPPPADVVPGPLTPWTSAAPHAPWHDAAPSPAPSDSSPWSMDSSPWAMDSSPAQSPWGAPAPAAGGIWGGDMGLSSLGLTSMGGLSTLGLAGGGGSRLGAPCRPTARAAESESDDFAALMAQLLQGNNGGGRPS